MAAQNLGDMFPYLPGQSDYNKLRKLYSTMTSAMGPLVQDADAGTDNVWIIDSTPLEYGRSRKTAQRTELAGRAGYGIREKLTMPDHMGKASPVSAQARRRGGDLPCFFVSGRCTQLRSFRRNPGSVRSWPSMEAMPEHCWNPQTDVDAFCESAALVAACLGSRSPDLSVA